MEEPYDDPPPESPPQTVWNTDDTHSDIDSFFNDYIECYDELISEDFDHDLGTPPYDEPGDDISICEDWDEPPPDCIPSYPSTPPSDDPPSDNLPSVSEDWDEPPPDCDDEWIGVETCEDWDEPPPPSPQEPHVLSDYKVESTSDAPDANMQGSSLMSDVMTQASAGVVDSYSTTGGVWTKPQSSCSQSIGETVYPFLCNVVPEHTDDCGTAPMTESNPCGDVVLVDSEACVPMKEHPVYGKYVKMLSVGLPKGAVRNKMIADGVDVSYLDMDPDSVVPLIPSIQHTNDSATKSKSSPPKVRRKSLHMTSTVQVTEESVWCAADDVDVELDETELEKLFTERIQSNKTVKKIAQPSKAKTVALIDGKRSQNACIALARLRVSFDVIRDRIRVLNYTAFTTDQLISLLEFLASSEEQSILSRYKGEVSHLGPAERYMLCMMGLKNARECIQCMLFAHQLPVRIDEILKQVLCLEQVCDGILLSSKLRKLLKVCLKVCNQLNGGKVLNGLNVESLVKLQQVKAFDRKTTVLRYIINLLVRHGEDVNLLPDVKGLQEASKISIEALATEKQSLLSTYHSVVNIIENLTDDGSGVSESTGIGCMQMFLSAAERDTSELSVRITGIRDKYLRVLQYFGEDSSLSSSDFFSMLLQFIEACQTEAIAAAKSLPRETDNSRAKSFVDSHQHNGGRTNSAYT